MLTYVGIAMILAATTGIITLCILTKRSPPHPIQENPERHVELLRKLASSYESLASWRLGKRWTSFCNNQKLHLYGMANEVQNRQNTRSS